MDKQADRYKDGQTDSQTDRYKDRQTDIQTKGQPEFYVGKKGTFGCLIRYPPKIYNNIFLLVR